MEYTAKDFEDALREIEAWDDGGRATWSRDAKIVAAEYRKAAALRVELEGLLRRARAKLVAYNKQTGGIYAGGEGLQFLLPDIDKMVKP